MANYNSIGIPPSTVTTAQDSHNPAPNVPTHLELSLQKDILPALFNLLSSLSKVDDHFYIFRRHSCAPQMDICRQLSSEMARRLNRPRPRELFFAAKRTLAINIPANK